MRRRVWAVRVNLGPFVLACADLLLVASNPLEHLAALAAPVGVMARGRWLPAAQLEKQMRVR